MLERDAGPEYSWPEQAYEAGVLGCVAQGMARVSKNAILGTVVTSEIVVCTVELANSQMRLLCTFIDGRPVIDAIFQKLCPRVGIERQERNERRASQSQLAAIYGFTIVRAQTTSQDGLLALKASTSGVRPASAVCHCILRPPQSDADRGSLIS